ncbi:hypothetical protein BJ165DRAFT_563325 [Panaeolus papilionaceus]|nr:hypothetical protein BJ165DRAFT_563325 [Panaeolus papilionaceus]
MSTPPHKINVDIGTVNYLNLSPKPRAFSVQYVRLWLFVGYSKRFRAFDPCRTYLSTSAPCSPSVVPALPFAVKEPSVRRRCRWALASLNTAIGMAVDPSPESFNRVIQACRRLLKYNPPQGWLKWYRYPPRPRDMESVTTNRLYSASQRWRNGRFTFR